MNYYNKHYMKYHEKTFFLNSSSFLKPVIHYFKKGGLILDVGCGSGRDLNWLHERSFETVGFEKSHGLAELARKNTACKIIEGDFETYDFSTVMADSIILVGALVHVPHKKIPVILCNITKGLSGKKTDSVFLTLKKGTGKIKKEDGRMFYLWEDQELKKIFKDLELEVSYFFENNSMLDKNDIWLSYILKSEL